MGEAFPLLAAVVALHPAGLLADEVAVVSVEMDGLANPVGGGLDEDAREPGRHEVLLALAWSAFATTGTNVRCSQARARPTPDQLPTNSSRCSCGFARVRSG